MYKSILTVATIAAAITMWGCGGREETSTIPDTGDATKGVVDDVQDAAAEVKDEAAEVVEESTE